jgi:hypothetical protein
MERVTAFQDKFDVNAFDDPSAFQFLEESQSTTNKDRCETCVHYKFWGCELESCDYKPKEISLYYLVR